MHARPVFDSSRSSTPVVILMGVSGVGKTSVGVAVAEQLGWEFFDGDDFHPPANVDKMSRGVPLDDDDRKDWLDALHQLIRRNLDVGQPAIIACSALKDKYRDFLREGHEGVVVVYLKAAEGVVADRIHDRGDHYFDPNLLASQYAALEEPQDAVTVDASRPLPAVVETVAGILQELD